MTNGALTAESFPLALRQRQQWFLWKLIHKSGQPKPSKVPCAVRTLVACNPTDATQWASFEHAMKAFTQYPGRFNGLGFSLQPGIVCIDLDHSLDDSGHALPWAHAILDRLPKTFTEISVSGRGLHVFGLGKNPGSRTKFNLADGQTVEIYDQKRFIALTGERFQDAPLDLADVQTPIDGLYADWMRIISTPQGKTPTSAMPLMPSTNNTGDNEILARMFASKHGNEIQALWHGDLSRHHGDESAADLALMSHLAYWSHGDRLQMERLFEQSTLSQRDKWQSRPDYRKMTLEKAFQGSLTPHSNGFSTDKSTVEIPWAMPKPLENPLPAVKPFDPDLLPDAVRLWVMDEAERMQAPIDFLAVAVMVILGSVIGRQIAIRPKAKDSWMVVCNLWGVMIGRPSSLKSPSLDAALKALKRLELKAAGTYQEELAAYEAMAEIVKIRDKTKEKTLAKNFSSKSASVSLKELAQEWQDVEPLPQKPPCKRFLSNDGTIEKIGEILSENPNGILVVRDELAGFLHTLEKEGRQADRAFYLEAWNGTGSYTVDRIIRGTVTIPGHCLSIFGGIQPSVISKWFYNAIQNTGKDDGLIQRFQMLVWPEQPEPYHHTDRAPNHEAKQQFYDVVERLSQLDADSHDANKDPFEDIPYLRFAPEAQTRFDKWFVDLQNRLRATQEPPALEAHFGKYASLIPSLALICHLTDGHIGPVSETALLKALAWGDYLTAHAQKGYDIGRHYYLDAAHLILNKIKAGKLESGFTLRTLKRKHWQGLDDTDAVTLALDELEEAGYLRREEQRTAGRPLEVFHINPLWLQQVGVSSDE